MNEFRKDIAGTDLVIAPLANALRSDGRDEACAEPRLITAMLEVISEPWRASPVALRVRRRGWFR